VGGVSGRKGARVGVERRRGQKMDVRRARLGWIRRHHGMAGVWKAKNKTHDRARRSV
jgi:hypothetical protein